jgi:hypothetical protein
VVTTISYSYNVLVDRVSETVYEVTTDYVLDLASSLTQVLQESAPLGCGEYRYRYGIARLMQSNPSEEKGYFLGDAFAKHAFGDGSVRMLADEDGEITLLRSYEPYEEVLANQAAVR